MQFVLDLARTLKVDPRGCFRRFFSKIKVGLCQRMLCCERTCLFRRICLFPVVLCSCQTADKPYQDVFNRELDPLKEQDRRCVQARMEGAMKELEEEERQKRVGPGGVRPIRGL
ncbi:hypothetical protein AMECASPLE_024180 [Ameca splendens]|uniref:Uncharacterized protein n=1 Tax=Ameca splendens TaxID=208324 RepID=A0ABV0XHC4_9TELE